MPYPSPPETEDETVSESSDTEEDSKSKETVNAEDTVSDNDRPLAQSMTYQFHNCHAVYLNSHNAHGVKVKNAGNNTPQVTCMSSPPFFFFNCDFRADEVSLAHAFRQ